VVSLHEEGADVRGWRAEAVRPRGVAENAAALADRGLIVAMRCHDRGALAEFYRRFRPVLVVAARRLTADAVDSEAIVEDVLTDAAVHFVSTTTPVPGSVAGYLVRMLRNRVLNALRARNRLDNRIADSSCTSEHAQRTSAGADHEVERQTTPAPAVARLAAALDAAMSEDDRMLATWLANGIAQQQIADWVGVSYPALCKRVSRLRARLRTVAERHVSASSADDRRALAPFLKLPLV
jgi:RNA polymerase sigma factor (sigma-70 family)